MAYALITGNNVTKIIGNDDNYVFSNTCFQTPKSLTESQRQEYGVLPIIEDTTVALSNQKVGSISYNIFNDHVQEVKNFVILTQPEIDSLHNENIKSQISDLEIQVTARRIREALLSIEGKTFIESIDSQIQSLRSQLI